jgi:SAM-dependent methyltransferase
MSACPLCGSDKTSSVSSRDRLGRRVRTWLCEDCGLVFNSPQARPKALIEAYIDETRARQEGPEPSVERTGRIFARMERAVAEYWPLLKDRRRVLDACAGSGVFAYVMGELGFQVEALEPNPDNAVFCHRVLGVEAHAHNVCEQTYPAGSFDFIRVHHILVHAPEPVALLRSMRDWLADDGLLYLELPNVEVEAALRPRGSIFDLGHSFDFNAVTLRVALAKAGFVEAEETRARHAGATAGFFRKAEPDPDARADANNARQVSDAITAHYGRAKRSNSISRFVEGLANRAAERRELKGLTSHRQAAEHFTARLKARLGLQPK